jgi:hypothetical protein
MNEDLTSVCQNVARQHEAQILEVQAAHFTCLSPSTGTAKVLEALAGLALAGPIQEKRINILDSGLPSSQSGALPEMLSSLGFQPCTLGAGARVADFSAAFEGHCNWPVYGTNLG